MTRPILTAAETRSAEAAVFAQGVAVFSLMERAGRAVADIVWDRFGPVETLILCGPGNNGGDGYVAAARLRERGVAVRVAATGDPGSEAAKTARAVWNGPVEPLASARPAPLLIDALFGTGLARPLAADVAEPALRLMTAARYRAAVDLPSGLATDNGDILSELPVAHLTVALGALKRAHRLQPAASRCGDVLVADIGLQAKSRVLEISRPTMATPGFEANKYSRGKVLVVAGTMPGATMLSACAAQRAGAGYVELLGAEGGGEPHALVRRVWDDAALQDRRIGAIVMGPGLGSGDEALRRLRLVMATDRPLVIDADALNLLPQYGLQNLKARVAPTVLTPHSGEYQRLFDIDGTALDKALYGAHETQAVMLLKGACTVVARPDGRAAIDAPAPAWLASAGTGDVLSGVLGAMLAQDLDPFDAAQAAVWLHAEAARRAGPFLIADDLISHLRDAVIGCL